MKRVMAVLVMILTASGASLAQNTGGKSNDELRKVYLEIADGMMPSQLRTEINFLALIADNDVFFTEPDKAMADEAGINFLRAYKMYFDTRKLIGSTLGNSTPVGDAELKAIQKQLEALDKAGQELIGSVKQLLNKIPLSTKWMEWENLVKQKLGDRVPKLKDEGPKGMANAWRLNYLAPRIDYLAHLIDSTSVIDKSYEVVIDRLGTQFLEGQFLSYEIDVLNQKIEEARERIKAEKGPFHTGAIPELGELHEKMVELDKLEKELLKDYDCLTRLVPNSPRWKAWGEKVAGDKNSKRPEGEWCGNPKENKPEKKDKR